LSTLTDLFNISIGASKKAVFAEKTGDMLRILFSQEKLPLKEGLKVWLDGEGPVHDALSESGIEKENVYYVIPPHLYYRNKIILPFKERPKIEGVIKYEVKEYLPDPEEDYLTDFYNIDNEVFTFSTEKGVVRELLQEMGQYRENLKAIVPYDVALLYGITALTKDKSYVLIDIGTDGLYIQWVDDLKIKTGISVKKNPDETDDGFKKAIQSELFMIFKMSKCRFVYLNERSGGEGVWKITEALLKTMEMSYQELPHFRYAKFVTAEEEVEPADTLTLYGLLQEVNQPPLLRVNLLKEEFKPRLKGYVSVKEFTIAGALLFFLLFLSVGGFAVDIRFRKNQIATLNQRIGALSESAFGESSVSIDDARRYLGDIQGKIDTFEKSTDRRFSGLRLLQELSIYLPGDIIIDYSDIIIERDHIKFSGKARTFSDIDRIREELLLSEYFTNVAITNTGTTGSTEGFTVTFVFDIDIVEDFSLGD
jgi:hypothetical protein